MEKQTGWADLTWALDQIRRESERPKRLKTGFPQIDEILGGGLSPGLVVLGGTPGVGKSTFCLQLAENVAMGGIPVLYFSLEMPEIWIVAKAISRRLFQMGSPITAARLMGGKEGGQLDEGQWEQVEQIKKSEEFRHFLENLHVWTLPLSAEGIKKKIKRFVEECKGDGRNKPLVIVDYLQIVPFVPLEKDSRFKSDKEKNDDKVKQFTQLAHEDEFTVILISSLNRSSYTGPMQISAFKETGGIEYSADLLLGLQFQNQRKNTNLTKERGKDPREVEVAVLKNRYGSSGRSVPLAYYAASDCFVEKKTKESKEADKPTPGQEKAESRAEKKKPTVMYSTVNNTKVAEEIRRGSIGSCCDVSKTGDMGTVFVHYKLYDKEGRREPAALTSLDCCVADAIYTFAIHFWEDGVPKEDAILPPRDLLRILTGDPRPTVTSQKLAELSESIKRLHEVQFDFNCREELEAREIVGIGPLKLREYNGPFLNIDIEEKSGGAWAGVEFRFKPDTLPLFLHSYGSEVNKQMIRLPSILLNVSDGKRNMNNTAEHICLKRLLAQRMEVIRHENGTEKGSNMRRISFRDGGKLLSELQFPQKVPPEGIPEKKKQSWEDTRKQKLKRLHQSVEDILKYYKRIKYISDYEEDKVEINLVSSFKVTGPIRDPNKLP